MNRGGFGAVIAIMVSLFLLSVSIPPSQGAVDAQSYGGEFRISLTLSSEEVRSDTGLNFQIMIENTGNESKSVLLDYWIPDTGIGNFGESIVVSAGKRKTLLRSLRIDPSVPNGVYKLSLKLVYSAGMDPVELEDEFNVVGAMEEEIVEPPPVTEHEPEPSPEPDENKYMMEIMEIEPKRVEAVKGEITGVNVHVTNNGNAPIHEVAVMVYEFPEWIEPTNNISVLGEGETRTISLHISVPSDTEVQEKKITVKAYSKETQTMGSFTLAINKTRREIVYENIERLRTDIKEMEGRIVSSGSGNISHMIGLLTRAENILNLAESSAMNGNWADALSQIQNIEDLMDNIENRLTATGMGIPEPNFLYYYVIILILLGVAVILLHRKNIIRLPAAGAIIRSAYKHKSDIADLLSYLKPDIPSKAEHGEEIDVMKKINVHPEIKKRIGRIEEMIKTLEEQKDAGIISSNTFQEMKESNRRKIRMLSGSIVCGSCGAVIDHDSRFCTECGTRMEGNK
ncbi:MAG: hypothetical protein JW754_00650 [Candidatus Aenigmarchaeota archaeon]|nr:hypothetical protein [Candidatus Aenigmarchaeota archaeon]